MSLVTMLVVLALVLVVLLQLEAVALLIVHYNYTVSLFRCELEGHGGNSQQSNAFRYQGSKDKGAATNASKFISVTEALKSFPIILILEKATLTHWNVFDFELCNQRQHEYHGNWNRVST